MKQVLKGKNTGKQPRLGCKLSEETKKKIGDANRGKPSNLKGKPRSIEFGEKISKAKLGKPSPNKKRYLITTPQGEEIIITGLTNWCKENGLSAGNMSSVANGRLRRYRGYLCQHIKD